MRKVMLITGASRATGIGAAVARRLARDHDLALEVTGQVLNSEGGFRR